MTNSNNSHHHAVSHENPYIIEDKKSRLLVNAHLVESFREFAQPGFVQGGAAEIP